MYFIFLFICRLYMFRATPIFRSFKCTLQTIGVCTSFDVLLHWIGYWLGHPRTFVTVRFRHSYLCVYTQHMSLPIAVSHWAVQITFKTSLWILWNYRDIKCTARRVYDRTLWSIVRRMEVLCENKAFIAAGILCPSELGTLGPRRSGKWGKQGNCAHRATEMYNNSVPYSYMWPLWGSKECGS